MTAGAHLDALESRAPELREQDLFARLPGAIAAAREAAPAFAESLAGIDPDAITDRTALARLPVIRKSDLIARQRADKPFGGFAGDWRHKARRVFASPGPLYEPEAREADAWRSARALHAAGLRAGDLLHVAFSYHLTPAAFMMEAGAFALGCPVFPGGTGQIEAQLAAMGDLRPDAYAGPPSFLSLLLSKADEAGSDTSSLRVASLGGEAVPPSLVKRLGDRGIAAFQSYGTADLGLVAYESAAREGLIVNEDIIVEILRPGTGEPAAEGAIGEIAVTVFNPVYPLIRFATGDLTQVLAGLSPCGRTNMRIKGWLGRADQSAKVRGMFVHPVQVTGIAARHPEIRRARLVVSQEAGQDRMVLHCEAGEGADGLAERLVDSIRAVMRLRGEAVLHAPGALPDDGRLIVDERLTPTAS
jgi:phenylacetate-CoA ligase